MALWQSEKVRDLLLEAHPSLEAEIRIIKTKGDAVTDRPLEKIGDKGLFTKELEVELIADRIDMRLKEGMILAVEPKAFLPGVGPVGVENTYVVTAEGPEPFVPLGLELLAINA